MACVSAGRKKSLHVFWPPCLSLLSLPVNHTQGAISGLIPWATVVGWPTGWPRVLAVVAGKWCCSATRTKSLHAFQTLWPCSLCQSTVRREQPRSGLVSCVQWEASVLSIVVAAGEAVLRLFCSNGGTSSLLAVPEDKKEQQAAYHSEGLPTKGLGYLKFLKIPSLLCWVCWDDFVHLLRLLKCLLFFCSRAAGCGNLFAVLV